MPGDFRITDPIDFEKHVGVLLQAQGYEVIMPEANTRGYDLEVVDGKDRVAVQIKNHKAKSNISQILQFVDFLELPLASRFTSGWFLSASGFSRPALTHIETERPSNLRLGIVEGSAIDWAYDPDGSSSFARPDVPVVRAMPKSRRNVKYFGVFTCKGGVGKTTVAAHLAGAFALQGYDVILLDLDPDKNLRKLFMEDPNDEDETASLYVPPPKRGHEGSVITVLNHEEWDESQYKDIKIVICDCSPVLNENPPSLVERFDYCVIPTTLNPLGIAKHADVITRTFSHIRDLNKKAEMFVVLNSYNTDKAVADRNEIMLTVLRKHIDAYAKKDRKCHLIEPSFARIRQSTMLQYWGYHIIEGSRPQLAFREIAGRSFPRTDFLLLAEYLEDHTSIKSINQ